MLLHEAFEHVSRARSLMTTDELAQLRYAALELRMAIEAAFYRFLPLYKEDLSDDLLREWHPRRILDALIEIDPGVERDSTIRMGFTPPRGEPLRPFMERRQRGVTRKLLRDYYHKPGSFVHATRPHDRPKNISKLKTFLEAAATRLEEHCRETTILMNAKPAVTIECECGRTFRRSIHAVRAKGVAVCPSATCGAIFDLTENTSGVYVKPRQETFVCPECQTPNYFLSHRLHPGVTFACLGCNTSFQIHDGPWISRNFGDTSQSQEDAG